MPVRLSVLAKSEGNQKSDVSESNELKSNRAVKLKKTNPKTKARLLKRLMAVASLFREQTLAHQPEDKRLKCILIQSGAYYESGKLLYHRLWRQRLRQADFTVVYVEKAPYSRHLWHVGLRLSLSAQSYLLLTKPAPKTLAKTDLLERQLTAEIMQIAAELGPRIRHDYITVIRNGPSIRVTFIWPRGHPGLLLQKNKKQDCFSFLIRPWLRQNRN